MRWPWVTMSRYRYERIQDEIVRDDRDITNLRGELARAQRDVVGLEQTVAILRTLAENDAKANEAVRDHLYAKLDEKDAVILALRREGFDPPAPQPPTTQELRKKMPPEVLHRIEQIAQPGTREHFEMLSEAEALIGAYPDRPAEQIADEVTEGSPISPYRL